MDAHTRHALYSPHRTRGVLVRRRKIQTTRVNQTRITWLHLHGYHPYAVAIPYRVDNIITTTTTTEDEEFFVPTLCVPFSQVENEYPLIPHPVVVSDLAHEQKVPVRVGSDPNQVQCPPESRSREEKPLSPKFGACDTRAMPVVKKNDSKVLFIEDTIKQEPLSPRLPGLLLQGIKNPHSANLAVKSENDYGSL